MASSNKITLWRIESSLTFSSIRDAARQNGYSEDGSTANTSLLVKRDSPSKPSWIRFVAPLLDTSKPQPKNLSSSFVYLINENGELFALTGGYGYLEIHEYVDQEFGIEVAFRMISDPKKIKALAQRAFKGVVRQLVRNVENYNPIADRDNFDKLLRSIHGKGIFLGKAIGVFGKASVSFRADIDINGISSVISEVKVLLKKQKSFEIPKSYTEVRNKTEITTAETSMVSAFSAFWAGTAGRENMYAEFDDPMSQFSCESFEIRIGGKIRGKKITLPDFDLDSITQAHKSTLGLLTISGIEDIRNLLVIGKDSNDEDVEEHSLADMLVFDTQINGDDYVKMGKRWYKIDQDFVKRLDDVLDGIDLISSLPLWDRSVHKTELDYNTFLAAHLGGECLDQKLIHIGKQKLELCDVFVASAKTFYHVKETWGSKSSYLFLQGTTSLEFYLNDAKFRAMCNKNWPSLFGKKISRGVVAYGIGMDPTHCKSFPKNLTFFAKLSLVESCHRIRELGYSVVFFPIEMK